MPGWVPRAAHHCLRGCYRCQEVCPANAGRLADLREITFDETETAAIINSKYFSDVPSDLKAKLWCFNDSGDFEFVPRNLRLMFGLEDK